MRVLMGPQSTNRAALLECGPLAVGRFYAGTQRVTGWFLLDTGATISFVSEDILRGYNAVLGPAERVGHRDGESNASRARVAIELDGKTASGEHVTLCFQIETLASPALPEAQYPCFIIGVLGREVLACGQLNYDGEKGVWFFDVDVDAVKARSYEGGDRPLSPPAALLRAMQLLERT